MSIYTRASLLFLLLFFISIPATQAAPLRSGTVVTTQLTSEILRTNKVGLETRRSILIYLPPGYENGSKRYPVIYFFHGLGISADRLFSQEHSPKAVFDRAIADRRIDDFILVAPDYSSPTLGSWFENSSTSGMWLDHTVKEVVPFIDAQYRTIRHRDSRGLAGEFTGGYGALKFAMLYPELFGAVYALHPVGTGSGLMPMHTMLDWKRLLTARTFEELPSVDYYAPGFVAMSQAYLPNPDKPPFHCDFIVELENGEPTLNVANLTKLQDEFLLDRLLPRYADNLRRLRGIALDWGRYDRTQSHVYSNQAFTRALDNLGIDHVAEEYNGNQFNKNWIPHGRVEDRMLPFFGRVLAFESVEGTQ